MSEHICPGKCNARFRAEWEAYDRAVGAWTAVRVVRADRLAQDPQADLGPEPERPAEPTLRPWQGNPIWCPADAAAIREALVGLDDLMTLHLHHSDGYGSPSSQERVSSSPEPPSPSPGHDLLDELLEWLGDWERAYRESQQWPTKPYRGASPDSLTSAIGWLNSRLSSILAHPDLAEGFGEGVLKWHRRLEGAAKSKPRRVSKPLRCPQCHLATLSQLEGEDRVECRNRDCGSDRGGPVVMTVAEYEGLLAERAPSVKQARRILTPHESVQPAPGDDVESRAAGPRGISDVARINPDTLRLTLDHPYREPVSPEEFARIDWPTCPRCGSGIAVYYSLASVPGKEPVTVGARTLPAIPDRVVAVPTSWRCLDENDDMDCSAGGEA